MAVRAFGPLLLVALAATSSDRAADGVRLVNWSPADASKVVYQGMVGGACNVPDEYVFAGGPIVALPAVSQNGNCPQQLSVFSRAHGAFISDAPTWYFAGSGQRTDVYLPPLQRLRVSIWFVVQPGDPNLAAAQVTLPASEYVARSAFLSFRTGIFLEYAVNTVTAGSSIANYIGTGCHNALHMRDAFDPRNDPFRGDAINVFVVPTIIDPLSPYPGGGTGSACYLYGMPNATYLAYTMTQATLGHELGHMLGLKVPDVVAVSATYSQPTWGHTGNLRCPRGSSTRCFPPNSMMDCCGYTISYLSLGEAYRMNFDSRSYLNRPAVAEGRAMVRNCQSDYLWWEPCPRLVLEGP